jgi:hypothetical protein
MLAIQVKTIACDGSDVFWPWLLWLLGAFLLGLLLGWLLKQLFGCGDDNAAVAGRPSGRKDDLTKIEGIGPKIQELLYNEGINNYEILSDTSTERLHKILVDAGPAYYTHKDITFNWAAQSLLADRGHWDELERWQKILKEGV